MLNGIQLRPADNAEPSGSECDASLSLSLSRSCGKIQIIMEMILVVFVVAAVICLVIAIVLTLVSKILPEHIRVPFCTLSYTLLLTPSVYGAVGVSGGHVFGFPIPLPFGGIIFLLLTDEIDFSEFYSMIFATWFWHIPAFCITGFISYKLARKFSINKNSGSSKNASRIKTPRRNVSRKKVPIKFGRIFIGLFLIALNSHFILTAMKNKSASSKSGSYSLEHDPGMFYFMISLYILFIILGATAVVREWRKTKG